MTAAPAQDVELINLRDAHKTLPEWLFAAYQEAFDLFAGPSEFRHGCNYDAYHRAGIIGVHNAMITRLRAALADALVDRNSYRDQLNVERAHSARVISWERARADAAMVDRNSYRERLSMERARADALAKDAERYRWLRRRTTIGVGMVNIWSNDKGRYDSWQEEELDAAIDAARSKP